MMNKGIILLAIMGFFAGACSTAAGPWMVDYGSDISEARLQHVKMAIVDPDHVSPQKFKSLSTQLYAYVSIGEVNNTRAWWPKINGASYVLGPNPEWPGAFRLDVRSIEWRDLLLNDIIPKIAEQGFAGIFLDTIDVPLYLEETDPQKFAGSGTALVALIREIHRQFPKLGIIPNNGFAIWGDIGKDVSAVLAEDVYTRYDFAKKEYGETPAEDSRMKEKALSEFRKRFKKPAYVVLYGIPGTSLITGAIEKCRSHGFSWYVANIDLEGAGQMENNP